MNEWKSKKKVEGDSRARHRGTRICTDADRARLHAVTARPRSGLVRKAAVTVAGFGVLAFGVALIVLPVPGLAILFIPLGLAILATEFRWARKLLAPIRQGLRRLKAYVQRIFGKPSPGKRADDRAA